MTNEPSNEPIGEMPPGDGIENMLAELQSGDSAVRRHRIGAIAEQRITDERILGALREIASSDPNGYMRKNAARALKALGVEAPALSPELAKKRRDFWIGVGIFFGLNIALWACQVAFVGIATSTSPNMFDSSTMNPIGIFVAFLPWLVNIGLIIFLAFKRPQMALGMLAGFGISLLIVVCLFLIVAAVCFVAIGSYQ